MFEKLKDIFDLFVGFVILVVGIVGVWVLYPWPATAYDQIVRLPGWFHSFFIWQGFAVLFLVWVAASVYGYLCIFDAASITPGIFMNLIWLLPLLAARAALVSAWFGWTNQAQWLWRDRFLTIPIISGLWLFIALIIYVNETWPRWAQAALDARRRKHRFSS